MEATVKPLSRKAKNRFANEMAKNSTVDIEQIRDGRVFFVSKNQRYAAWTPVKGVDWEVTITGEVSSDC